MHASVVGTPAAPGAERARAAAFLEDGQLATNKARELEVALDKLGDFELAKKVYERREALDRERALRILGGREAADVEALLELAKSFKQYREIATARRLLMLACQQIETAPKLEAKVFQQAALCTYKDPDLPLDWKLERALEILCKPKSLAETNDPETLGIAGAVFKRKWDADGQRHHLERALFYYLRGYALGAPLRARKNVLDSLESDTRLVISSHDHGYTGINAAFVLDLLAAEEEDEARRAGITPPDSIAKRRRQAGLIREELTRSVPPLVDEPEHAWIKDEWFYYATMGEAFFGLGRHAEAREWLTERPARAGLRVGFGIRSAAGLQVPEWEYESTTRQLARLARLRCLAVNEKLTEEAFQNTDEAETLRAFLARDERAVLSEFRGKFGLGLSGGGFRASFFHIGVLARLAELGVLPHVEVLSCVSGGSIVGAHYYLELRHLLQTKADGEITPEDYFQIVERVQEQFLKGVQRNIRTRVLAEFFTNVKMILLAGYSRTLRVGELYERELYARVRDGHRRGKPRRLRDLKVCPKVGTNSDGSAELQHEFKPTRDNWRRNNKVPVLVLNACTLNTGHNWQFTATYMGEPPLPIQTGIDTNYRLRRFYYQDQPKKVPDITLGQAVAASACVPGLFEPLVLDGYYPDGEGERRITVRLVDGGVCDNQGITGLLEQDCSVMLISDGSGQMDAQDMPSAGLIGVPLRSNSILQSRVRVAQHDDVAARRRSNLLRGLMFVHLKQDLASAALAWRDCPSHEKISDVYTPSFDVSTPSGDVTSYGMPRAIQAKLAAVRTDLDSFCDAEAYALMASGYRMTGPQFQGLRPCVEGFAEGQTRAWKFLAIDAALKQGPSQERLQRLLDASRSSAFKIWQLSRPLIALKWILAFGAVGSVIGHFVSHWSSPVLPSSAREWLGANLTYGRIGWWGIGLLVTLIVTALVNALVGATRGKYVVKAIHWRDTLKDVAIGVGMSLGGWIVARGHLHLFDRIYLRYGRIDRFTNRTGKAEGDGR